MPPSALSHFRGPGKIEDIVVDADSGRILYAVVDFGGFLGIGNKLFPVLWLALAALPSGEVLDKSKEQLQKAPGFDKNNLPDVGDRHWDTRVMHFHRVSRAERREARDYDYSFSQKDLFAKSSRVH